jgi:hypothetical protein
VNIGEDSCSIVDSHITRIRSRMFPLSSVPGIMCCFPWRSTAPARRTSTHLSQLAALSSLWTYDAVVICVAGCS